MEPYRVKLKSGAYLGIDYDGEVSIVHPELSYSDRTLIFLDKNRKHKEYNKSFIEEYDKYWYGRGYGHFIKEPVSKFSIKKDNSGVFYIFAQIGQAKNIK